MKNVPHSLSHQPPRRGFTLVEIMVVVAIIGLLATLAIPTVLMSRASAKSAAFINDLRQARAIFETFALENGTYPADAAPAVVPAGMTEELDPVRWTEPTAIGGNWEWDYQRFGVVAGVSVAAPEMSVAQMARIDARIDDGNLATGVFRQRAGGYIYIVE